jgi:hypothetical protein
MERWQEMDKKSRAMALLLLAWPAAAHATGDIAAAPSFPPLVRLWDQGVGSWLNVGASSTGAVASLSADFEKTVRTVHAAYVWRGQRFGGGQLGLSIGLPLSKKPLLAVAGAGAGALIGIFDDDPRVKGRPCLLGDLQLFYSPFAQLGIGIYSTAALSVKGVMAHVFFCLQFGRGAYVAARHH